MKNAKQFVLIFCEYKLKGNKKGGRFNTVQKIPANGQKFYTIFNTASERRGSSIDIIRDIQITMKTINHNEGNKIVMKKIATPRNLNY